MPRPMLLGPNQVHVWQATLTLPDRAWRDLWALLSEEERAHADRHRSEQDRQRYAVAHGVLRLLLAGYRSVPPAEIRFIAGPHGKPALAEPSIDRALRFNLAHSGELALFAFAAGREVGVDIETISTRTAEPALAERRFAPGERRAILSRPPAERARTFARLWTLKESYLKALGSGLTQPLDSFEIGLDGDVPTLTAAVGTEGVTPSWSLRELGVGPEYAAALCVQGTGWELTRKEWSPA